MQVHAGIKGWCGSLVLPPPSSDNTTNESSTHYTAHHTKPTFISQNITTMASILITAATGHLGQLVVDNLLASGVPAQSIAVAVRNASKAESLGWTAKGIQARKADYLDGPEVWAVALKGIERVLLISSSDLSTETARLDGQLNIIRAAEKAGVKWIAYTSLLHADTNPMKLAEDHVASEAAIVKTGIPYVFLRNGWCVCQAGPHRDAVC